MTLDGICFPAMFCNVDLLELVQKVEARHEFLENAGVEREGPGKTLTLGPILVQIEQEVKVFFPHKLHEWSPLRAWVTQLALVGTGYPAREVLFPLQDHCDTA